jgi:uridine phosphorylase
MAVHLVEGVHLTATNKRHLSEIIGNGWTHGRSNRIAYTVAQVEGVPSRYSFRIEKAETDDWGKPVTRISRGIIEVRGVI